jgi:class 3 adenylate cyclase
MIRESKLDFFDVKKYLSPEAMTALKKIPHILLDGFGNEISAKSREQATAPAGEIKIGAEVVAQVSTTEQQKISLESLLAAEIAGEFRNVSRLEAYEANELLFRDMDEILRISEFDELDFEEQLTHLLKILRAHTWVERASIFGIYDGFTLEGLAGIGGMNQQNWKMDFSSLAGIAATTRKVYHSEDPSKDPNFRAKEGAMAPKNIVCYPLLHGKTLVGVMNLSNKVGGAFQAEDLKIIEMLSHTAAHILQKHYFKKRMQSFERTSDHLGKYLSSKVVKNVKNLNQIELGGAEKRVVCLFADIRGYTTISEGLKAPVLVNLLNIYFEKMNTVIEKYEGSVDKIVGDLIMAVWNIPLDQPEPELLAMKAAIEMQKEMARGVAPEWAKSGIPRVGIGIGVNAGIAVAGNLGSSRFMNYTVIGDTINIAQRIEAKAQAGEVWMAEHLFEFVNGKLEKPVRKECDIKLKGKDKTINAYVYHPLSYK